MVFLNLNQIKSEEYKICLGGEKNQKQCDNFLLCSNNHEMFLQKVKK